jgi:VanZ family protein
MNARRSAAVPLAVVAALLVAYASLYPMTGWRHPAGWDAWREIQLPWPARWTESDAWLNVLGYLPFGAVLFLAFLRGGGWPPRLAALGAIGLAGGWSLAMEVLQNFLPQRVPSSLDLAWNVAGAVAGTAAAAIAHGLGWFDRGANLHARWFEPHRTIGTTLLLLWPVGLLIPTPVALGLGQGLEHLIDTGADAVKGSFAEPALQSVLGTAVGAAREGAVPALSPGAEAFTVALGLLAPCLLAVAIARPGWRRIVLVAGAGAAAFAVLTVSTALNFGPQHALAWRTAPAQTGIVLGMVAGVLVTWVPHRVAAGLGLVTLTALLIMVALAPADPYFAQSLQAWEQGRFVRLHGAAHWIGWLWPIAAMLYLLSRLADERP